jgi:hypothetical protein
MTGSWLYVNITSMPFQAFFFDERLLHLPSGCKYRANIDTLFSGIRQLSANARFLDLNQLF